MSTLVDLDERRIGTSYIDFKTDVHTDEAKTSISMICRAYQDSRSSCSAPSTKVLYGSCCLPQCFHKVPYREHIRCSEAAESLPRRPVASARSCSKIRQIAATSGPENIGPAPWTRESGWTRLEPPGEILEIKIWTNV